MCQRSLAIKFDIKFEIIVYPSINAYCANRVPPKMMPRVISSKTVAMRKQRSLRCSLKASSRKSTTQSNQIQYVKATKNRKKNPSFLNISVAVL